MRGEPTPEELAALVAVLSTRNGEPAVARARQSGWTDRSRLVRRTPAPGPGAWRATVAPP